jgi:tetratricopeptide (TPR) repeat protein
MQDAAFAVHSDGLMSDHIPGANTTSAISSASDDRTRENVAALARMLQMSKGDESAPAKQPWGGGIVLIGAGCSVSAGIPLAAGVVDIALEVIGRQYRLGPSHGQKMTGEAYLEALQARGQLTDAVYGAGLYERLFSDYLRDVLEREVIHAAIAQGEGRINLAHIRLGQLVAGRFFHTILTTNFDQLALVGMVKAEVWPSVADGQEAVIRIVPQPQTAQLIHVHGSLHNYRRVNSAEQVEAVAKNQRLRAAFTALLTQAPFLLVVGYRGEENGLMQPLADALKDMPEKPVFWAAHGRELPESVRRLLKDHAGLKPLLEQDADKLFNELARAVELGEPDWIADPLATLRRSAALVVKAGPEEWRDTLGRHEAELEALQNCLTRDEDNQAPANTAAADLDRLLLAGKWAEVSAAARAMTNPPWEKIALSASEAVESIDDPRAGDLLREAARHVSSEAVDSAVAGKIGLALLKIGETQGDTEPLDRAIEFLTAAAQHTDRGRVPLDWAATQNNLGAALQTLGARESGTARLEEAVAAYRAALEERRRDRVPLDWAMTQNNLGAALRALGERGDAAALPQAIAAYEGALEDFRRAGADHDITIAERNLARARALLPNP